MEDGIAAQIRNIESEYGKPIGAWIELVNAGGLAKHAHIALLARAAEQPAPANAGKKAALRPVHDALIAAINAFGIGIEQIGKEGLYQPSPVTIQVLGVSFVTVGAAGSTLGTCLLRR